MEKETSQIKMSLPQSWYAGYSGRVGFTLIELLVVILIIGILAAIALPQYQKTVLKSCAVQGLVKLKAMETAQRAYYLVNGSFATEINALDIEGIMDGNCGSASPIIYCNIPLNSPLLKVEWHGIPSRKTRWLCMAKTSSSTANEICAAYNEEWGKSANPNESPNGFTYYYGTWRD